MISKASQVELIKRKTTLFSEFKNTVKVLIGDMEELMPSTALTGTERTNLIKWNQYWIKFRSKYF